MDAVFWGVGIDVCFFVLLGAFIQYRLVTTPTGRTRLVKEGGSYRVQCECLWLGFIPVWRYLGHFKPLPGMKYGKEYVVTPMDKTAGLGAYKKATFAWQEQAESAAREWRTQQHIERLKHQHDGPICEITAPIE